MWSEEEDGDLAEIATQIEQNILEAETTFSLSNNDAESINKDKTDLDGERHVQHEQDLVTPILGNEEDLKDNKENEPKSTEDMENMCGFHDISVEKNEKMDTNSKTIDNERIDTLICDDVLKAGNTNVVVDVDIPEQNGNETVSKETSLKKDNTRVRSEKKDNVTVISDDLQTLTNVPRSTKRATRKAQKHSMKGFKSSSSSDDDDDNIPLCVLVNRFTEQSYTSSSEDETYIPNSKELNSSDSEYFSDLSDSAKRQKEKDDAFRKMWTDSVSKVKSKPPDISCDQHATSSTLTDHEATRDEQEIARQKQISYQEEIIRNTLIVENEGRLDNVLNIEGLSRVRVLPHGNCFFEAACHSAHISESHTQLRQSICSHLEENAPEYIGFLQNKHNNTKEECNFKELFLAEIQSLKKDGYWSNKVADMLPLALSNYTQSVVSIYTSKPELSKIVITPTLNQDVRSSEINIAYISIPNVMEHYDACCQSGGQEIYTARPILNLENVDNSIPEEAQTAVEASVETPKKSAKFVSPAKRRTVRKRKATPENWKKNIRKRLRVGGEEYVSTSGKIVPKKQVKECNCSGCKYKCSEKISRDKRCQLRDFYYGLDSYERQKDYICSNVLEQNTRTYLDNEGNKVTKRKQVMRIYSFEVDEVKVRVCKRFFLKTLDISEANVTQALSKKSCGHFEGRDGRGRHKAPNKTSDLKLTEVRNHINSFPSVESHYTRKSTSRQYLAANLNIKRMYEEYVSQCQQKQTEPVKEPIYRRVFNEEYNLSFHVPKKDQCNVCNRYENAKSDETLDEATKEEYTIHQKRKIVAREQKHNDSTLARENPRVHTCTFDLQSVLYTPCSLVSVMYYMRKLCCYNLSVYSAGDKRASCYLWSETDGKRGSNEISNCLNLYLAGLDTEVEHVILYSDACTGQNRNQIVATTLLYSLSTIPHLKIIDHKFLESGHTQMECDSMHSAIEFAKSKTKIFVPSQWETVITMSRRKNPYNVISLKYYDFKDFKSIRFKSQKTSKAESGEKARWTSMRWMRFVKEEPEMCLYKYELDNDTDFQRVRILPSKKSIDTPASLYKTKLQISSAKKKDLVHLCKQGVIPTEFHEFYKGLPSSQNVKERLPEPDVEESENDTDID